MPFNHCRAFSLWYFEVSLWCNVMLILPRATGKGILSLRLQIDFIINGSKAICRINVLSPCLTWTFRTHPTTHPFSLPRLSSWRSTPPVSRDKVTILYAKPFNVAWLKFSVLLLISKVMRQWCVIIENPVRCPPIPHPGTPGPPLDSPSCNVPRKPDKAVINAESLSSDSGHRQVTSSR